MNSLIQEQRQIIRRFHEMKSDYDAKKAKFSQLLAQEQAMVERQWQDTRAALSVELQQIQCILRDTQRAFADEGLLDKFQNGEAKQIVAPADNNADQSMAFYLKKTQQFSSTLSEYIQKKQKSRIEERSRRRSNVASSVSEDDAPGCLGCFVGLSVTIFFIVLMYYFLVYLIPILLILVIGVTYGLLTSIIQEDTIKSAYTNLVSLVSAAQAAYNLRLVAPERTYLQQLEDAKKQHSAVMKQLENEFSDQLRRLQSDFNLYLQHVGVVGVKWEASSWERWDPSETTTPIIRLGELSVGPYQELLSIPALIGCPGGENILFEGAGEATSVASNSIQSCILRLLATQPPNKIYLTLIDPLGAGGNLAGFMQLEKYNKELVAGKVWSEPRQIEEQLAKLKERMEVIIQKHLQNRYQTLEQYNELAGELAEPYRVLAVIGFPFNFTPDAVRLLIDIVNNGPRCGISALILMDTKRPLPDGFDVTELKRAVTTFSWENQCFVWQDNDFGKCQIVLDLPPKPDLFNRIVQEVGQQAQSTKDVRISFERIAPAAKLYEEQKYMSRAVRILFLAANPKDTQSLRLDEEVRSIDSSLRQAEFRDAFDIRQHWALRVTDLQGYLLRHQPDIVHFSGHGNPLSEIILEDNDGKSHPVSPRALSQVFSVLKDNVRCVVLNACYSEHQAQAIAQYIDCVVGMSKAIGDSAAISFASAFYQALGYGRNIKTAFELGRAQIDLANLNEQDTPKLLVNNNNSEHITFIEQDS
ncbi:MAG TPA: CHAT domain-containing protein [Ktedonobacteraceae bacterium]|nr:CHAT domain-containing protein [Ktedonobacteraceae bacterium]